MSRLPRNIISGVVGISFLFPLFAGAQLPINPFESAVEITISPDNPGRNTEVTASLITSAFDQNAAFIAWALNGNILTEGTGNKTLRFNTGTSQAEIVLEAIIQPRETREVIRKTLRITPAEVDIVVEADGYTPPFYEGKTHPVLQGRMFFTAVPSVFQNGSRVDASDLIYTWSKSGRVLYEQSGYGQNVIILVLDFLSRPFTLSVEARTTDGSIVASDSVSINPGAPKLVFYREDPLAGVELQKGYMGGQIPMNSQELWIKAVPYFSDKESYESGNQIFSWDMNNAPVSQGVFRDKIVLRRPEGVENGVVQITAEIEDGNRLLQSLRERFSILIQPVSNTAPRF